jgi:hypothetical protein
MPVKLLDMLEICIALHDAGRGLLNVLMGPYMIITSSALAKDFTHYYLRSAVSKSLPVICLTCLHELYDFRLNIGQNINYIEVDV